MIKAWNESVLMLCMWPMVCPEWLMKLPQPIIDHRHNEINDIFNGHNPVWENKKCKSLFCMGQLFFFACTLNLFSLRCPKSITYSTKIWKLISKISIILDLGKYILATCLRTFPPPFQSKILMMNILLLIAKSFQYVFFQLLQNFQN